MKERILDILKTVQHPAKGSDVVTLGMIENLKVEGGEVKFTLVFPSKDPLSASIKANCVDAVHEVMGEACQVSVLELVRASKPAKRKLELGAECLADVGKIIAVASGKGGVGKSTVAVNLAISLARMGYKVGLADADVYGPSVPKMTGTEDYQPDATVENGQELILPVEKYGVKWMSIGYFAAPDQALIWRGPMACNALKQMILQVKWGELDYLLIDLPPGTGDIHITLVGDIPLDGALIVSTPQAVALADVEKGINLFSNPNVNKPVLGIVENMSWFTPAELPDNKYYIFGKGGCEAVAAKYGIPVVAQIPLVQSICENGDNGTPSALQDGPVFDAFKSLRL